MGISKTASQLDNFKNNDFYYNSAREGMYDLISNMVKTDMIHTIFIPGYIGWSPKEGSGIFDPISKIKDLNIVYYKMKKGLEIDSYHLTEMIKHLANEKFAVLLVNYFGFIDSNYEELVAKIKEFHGWIIEDNAHGFFTYLYSGTNQSDATFFSLHKMFPFSNGGMLKIRNKKLLGFSYLGLDINQTKSNPWIYDIYEIALTRRKNYLYLNKIITDKNREFPFEPLKNKLYEGIIPQTYPIILKKGNRNKIYDQMNEAGFGVVSLYHTLIEPLQNDEFKESVLISRNILNLPVHQDVDVSQYEEMILLLTKLCDEFDDGF
jgi:dTDP-4-amino-4,6-dideoxygalactose transaminase